MDVSSKVRSDLYCSYQGGDAKALERALGNLLTELLVDQKFGFDRLYDVVQRIICAKPFERAKVLESALKGWFMKRYDRIDLNEHEKERLIKDIKTKFKGAKCIEDVARSFLKKISPKKAVEKNENKLFAQKDSYENTSRKIASAGLLGELNGLKGKIFGSDFRMFSARAVLSGVKTPVKKAESDLGQIVATGLITRTQKEELQKRFSYCKTSDSKAAELVRVLRINYEDRFIKLYNEDGTVDLKKLDALTSFTKNALVGSSYIGRARELILSDLKGMGTPNNHEEELKMPVYAANDLSKQLSSIPEAVVEIKIVNMDKDDDGWSTPEVMISTTKDVKGSKVMLAYKD
ncbi:MAG: hypothetical protein ABIE74_04340 [Pseudomonadota bacterium]